KRRDPKKRASRTGGPRWLPACARGSVRPEVLHLGEDLAGGRRHLRALGRQRAVLVAEGVVVVPVQAEEEHRRIVQLVAEQELVREALERPVPGARERQLDLVVLGEQPDEKARRELIGQPEERQVLADEERVRLLVLEPE